VPSPSSHLRRLAGATAISMVFAATAQSAGLIDNDAAVNHYRPLLSQTIATAAKDDLARGRARGFMVELENVLKEPSEKARVIDYPKPVSANMLRIIAVVPPKGMEQASIPVCAEKDSKVLGTWAISFKGEVVPAPWTGTMVSEGNSSACKAFILASREAINRQVAVAPE
jgi:hypothetical protein